MLTVSLTFCIDCMDVTILVEMNDQAENRFYCQCHHLRRRKKTNAEVETETCGHRLWDTKSQTKENQKKNNEISFHICTQCTVQTYKILFNH